MVTVSAGYDFGGAMATAFIGMGAPCSGKTEFLKTLAEQEASCLYVSVDDIRQQFSKLSGKRLQKKLWAEVYRQVYVGLSNKQDVVIDAVNAFRGHRKRLIDHCNIAGADLIVGVWLKTPLRVCLERNQDRAKPIPEALIKQGSRRLDLEPPMLSEGFHSLTEVDISR